MRFVQTRVSLATKRRFLAHQERWLPPFHDPTEMTMNGFLPGRLLILGVAATFALATPYAAAQSVREGRTAQDRPYVAGRAVRDQR
jgi:hypothetical protein